MHKILTMKLLFLSMLCIALFAASPVKASNSNQRLALSNKHNLIVVGGTPTRVLYIIDKNSLEVTERIWIESELNSSTHQGQVWFSQDENSLWLAYNNELIQYSVPEFKIIKRHKATDNAFISPDHSIIGCLQSYKKEISLFNANDGSELHSYALSVGNPVQVGINTANDELLIVHKIMDDDTEDDMGLSKWDIDKKYEGQPDSLKIRIANQIDKKKRLYSRHKLSNGLLIDSKESYVSRELNDLRITAYKDKYYVLSDVGCYSVSTDFSFSFLNFIPGGHSFNLNPKTGRIVNTDYEGVQIYEIESYKLLQPKIKRTPNRIGAGSQSDEKYVYSFVSNHTLHVHDVNGTKVKTIAIY